MRTWILEFYPRPELKIENPFVIAEGVELIRDVSPDSAGHKRLIDELRELHGGVVRMLAIVDVSGSFAATLQRVMDDLRELLAQGAVLHDDIIWFADKAARSTANLDALERGDLQPPSGLGGGTSFRSALDLAEAVCKDAPGTLSLRIYTDGQFDDVSLSWAADHLRQWADVEVVGFADTKQSMSRKD